MQTYTKKVDFLCSKLAFYRSLSIRRVLAMAVPWYSNLLSSLMAIVMSLVTEKMCNFASQ